MEKVARIASARSQTLRTTVARVTAFRAPKQAQEVSSGPRTARATSTV